MRRRYVPSLPVAALLSVCAPLCIAQELPSMYGIQLGATLSVPECHRTLVVGQWSYSSPTNAPCYARNLNFGRTSDTPIGDEVVSVQWPSLGGPEIARDSRLSVRLVGGVAHRIELKTQGLQVQEKAFELLIAKFGKPAESRTVPMQNRMGAKYEAIMASWRDAGAFVTLLGMTTTIDQGSIIVETQTGRDAEKAVWDKLSGPRPKM